ncbi:isoleucine--tRNA ligase [Lacipirellula parvula]|uniref:Isoleucine--tRNA ligase n=1 Tax=Lacipirellula parvula TaxID=2650471 RepID=A0A5K7XF87_9BACT|nr:isoleucine--tRNA ligase [Lacipirellula parvula]BBO32903.1 isoleucyl-tRNA synthetase [Lacipirellula parvula]
MFPPVDKDRGFPERELDVLRFWKERNVYQQTLDARDGAPPFVFFEGPPTANGMPHPGHCLTRSIKDLYPRYKTMRGYRCERKAGWDTHGLPVEVEVCKELGIHSKEEIENFGIEPFIQKCQASVWRYMNEWERLTERLGFWVDLQHAYVTYHQSFIESVWWSLKNLFDRGLLYKGHKIVWWWAQGGTALSSGEVGQGYREVADPSVYVKFPLVDDKGKAVGASLLVWTTTPWTLPSNQFVAINPKLSYCNIYDEDSQETLIVASDLAPSLEAKLKRPLKVVGELKAESLIGSHYAPPFDCYQAKDIKSSWRVVSADFVTTDSGTGLVHIAPAFGEDDYNVLQQLREQLGEQAPSLINCVGPDGKFTAEAPEFVRGRWVKDCDKDIIRDLKSRGLLFHQEQYLHDYPFCWRAEEDPLIQYPRESWFIRTTAFKDAMLENNSKINWLPEHIRDGRFGKFLESNVDWALSRERFWGTPLPIWVCSETGKMEALGGYDELLAKPGVRGTDVWDEAKRKNPELVDDLRVHKPYIDAVTYDSPFAKGARMERVTEVIDCWYDSGAMPFAQWGYRGEGGGGKAEGGSESAERFHSQFPADFISEAIDQTRGWFYSQLAISTMLWGSAPGSAKGTAMPYPHPFRNCIVLGHMLAEWWESKDGKQLFLSEEAALTACGNGGFVQKVGKMSKGKRNYREPSEIFDRYGADALRWYFFANQPPWTSIRYSEQSIKDSVPEFLLRLWNVYSFFTIYANIDGFDPATSPAKRPLAQRSELDRWIVSELNRTAAIVVERMDAYDNFAACAAITEFVDALSNWYVRRSRDRFWAADKQSAEKLDAYWTLYECLTTTAQLIAPFTPFLAESLWQNLVAKPLNGAKAGSAAESVHLCDYPTGDASAVDEQLSARMNLVRHISSLGRQARTSASLKVRQPLARVEVILADNTHQKWLEEHAAVIAEELNVKLVEFSDEPDKYVEHEVLPNFKLLGKKLGKLMPKVKPALASQSGAELLANLRDNGKVDLVIDGEAVELLPEELEVRFQAKPGWTAANDKGVVVVLATEVTPELLAEGLARDLVRVIQDRRKEMGCEFTDRINVGVVSAAPELIGAVESFREYISAETLAAKLTTQAIPNAAPLATKVGDADVELYLQVAS